MIKVDNENVRAWGRCPLCEGYKEIGLVVCWPCYRKYGLRNGNPEAENKIEEANNELECNFFFKQNRRSVF
jgi:hypothetical protein